jgi:hypothetical protein
MTGVVINGYYHLKFFTTSARIKLNDVRANEWYRLAADWKMASQAE